MPKQQTLLDITDDALALYELVEELGGDVSDEEVEAAIEEFFNENENALVSKVDNYAALIKQLEYQAKCRKDHADQLAKKAKTDASRVTFLKGRLHMVMTHLGRKKIECPRFTVGIRKAGGKIGVEVDDADQLPETMTTLIPAHREPNKDAIRAYLQNGGKLEGARLKPQSSYVSIA